MQKSIKIFVLIAFLSSSVNASGINPCECVRPACLIPEARSYLAAQSIFKPITDDGIEYSAQLETEVLMGIRLLHSGRPPSAVNGFLIDRLGETGKQRIVDFLPGVRRSAHKTVEKFSILGRDDVIYQIRYESAAPAAARDISPDSFRLYDVFEDGSSVTITRSDNGDRYLHPDFDKLSPEEFALRVYNIRKRYYGYLNDLPANGDEAIHVIRYGKEFRHKIIGAIRGLFNHLGVDKGITLITAGSFAINEHVEGSDFDWYFVTDGTPESTQMVDRILEIFKQANIRLDKDIVPIYDPREGQKIQDDWQEEPANKPQWVSVSQINRFFEVDPFSIVGKIVGTLNIMYLGGDKRLYDEVESIYERKAIENKFHLGDSIIRELEYTIDRAFDHKKFDLKFGRGMLFNINCTLWLLQIMKDDFNLALEDNTPFIMLHNYHDHGYLSDAEKDRLIEILCFYLVLRNAIVCEAATRYAHPSGYEREYNDYIAEGVAGRLGFGSREELESKVTEYSGIVVEISKKIAEKYKSAKAYRLLRPEKGIAMADEMRLSKESGDERSIAQKTFQYLKREPVNMHIGLSPISHDRLTPQEAESELEENMETLSHLIALHYSEGLNIRYVLEGGVDAAYRKRALEILRSKVKEFASMHGINGHGLLSCLDSLHQGEGVVKVVMADTDTVKNIKMLGDNEYPVALENESADDTVSCIPNYTAAFSIGLSLVALRLIKRDEPERYSELRDSVLGKLTAIYSRYAVIFEKKEFTAEQLDLMVSGHSQTRLYYAVLYALPPAVKISVDRLREHHKYIQLLIRFA